QPQIAERLKVPERQRRFGPTIDAQQRASMLGRPLERVLVQGHVLDAAAGDIDQGDAVHRILGCRAAWTSSGRWITVVRGASWNASGGSAKIASIAATNASSDSLLSVSV